MNDIYRKEWTRLQNYFMPQQKLQPKYRFGAKIKRSMDNATSPFERLILIQPELERSLRKIKSKSNPFKLRHSQKVKVRQLNTEYKKVSELFTGGKMAL
jgi:hypothetical protein